MIKLGVLDSILKKHTEKGMLDGAKFQFEKAFKSKGEPFVVDIGYKDFTYIPTNEGNLYLKKGLDNLSAVSMSLPKKKQFDPTTIPQGFVVYTGLLGSESVVGVDTSKSNEKSVNIFTRSEKILRELFENGAFEETFTLDDLDAIIEKMEKKIGTGVEKGALAFARLDIINAMKDSVVYKITLPNFRTDIGDTLKFYPYGVFPYLSTLLKDATKDNALTIMQTLQDGTVKLRKVSFTDKAVKVLYKGFEKSMVESKLKKCQPGWDVLALNIKAHNLESSLYSTGYTNINLEDVIQMTGCKLSEVDKSQYAVNYDDLRGHFKTCVNIRWKKEDFLVFKPIDLSGFANNQDRKDAAMVWLDSVDNSTLYSVMDSQPELFGDVVESLSERERRAPKEFKKLAYVDLPDDKDEKLATVKEMLKKGVVRLTKTSKKSNKVSEVVCTNNGILLSRILGKNYVEKYESVGIKLQYLRNMLERTNMLDDFTQLEDKLYAMGLNNYVDIPSFDRAVFETTASRNKALEDKLVKDLLVEYGQELKSKGMSDSDIEKELSLPKIEKRFRQKAKTEGKYLPYTQIIEVLDGGKENIKSSSGGNPYLVTYKKVYSENDKDFYGSVDIDNVISVEYAELGIK